MQVSFPRSPQAVFLVFAAIGGLLLLGLVAPVAGGNEQMNFQRAASLASGHVMVGPTRLPGGFADILRITAEDFPQGKAPPYSYSRKQFDRLASVDLRSAEPEIVRPNPIAVLHPVSYLPQAPVIALGTALGLNPLAIFYLARLAGLVAGILLTFQAIKVMPMHKWSLAAVALLPPLLFSRSTLDADQFTVGLSFLFGALVLRELAAPGPIRTSAVVALAVTAFLLAQAKSAYLLVPLFAMLIPGARFGGLKRKVAVGLLVVGPGLLASLIWMMALRMTFFDGISYSTWSGTVRPDAQMTAVLATPLDFVATLFRTVATTPLVPRSLIDFLGVFGPPVVIPLAFLPMLGIGLAAVMITEPRGQWTVTLGQRLYALGIVAVSLGLILTLLYLQWTRYGGDVVEGFNGRYLYPLVPLLLLAVPPGGQPVLFPARTWLLLLGLVSLVCTLWTTWTTYWA